MWHDGNNTIPRPAAFTAGDEVPATGAILFGDRGMILHGSHGAGGCRLLPDKLMEQFAGTNAPAEKLPRVKNHAWDWIEAVRTGRQAGSNFGFGGPLTQAALIGAIAIRFPGQILEWDNAGMRFSNDAANAFVSPAYREGWKL